ncbi:DUF5018 domain-containing protein [Flavobacterium sp. LS1R49]|uniref:DUF5018 domain-containing protein n=1 Tax=Flavobacterium shii TaxID=2987687 RepID=A0A9X2ZB98_9FLAO|nr:DUF5018 domain-containing protein [Flavobacterium shii]MCV9927260.1 DUF5018 domain-containing protein [Flavobacterium shii]
MKIKTLLIFLTTLLLFNCSKDDSQKLSSENKILTFKLTSLKGDIYIGKIDDVAKTITLTTKGIELENQIIPDIEISEKATISPDKIPQDFNKQITYTITAENGNKVIYNVITNNTPLSNEKKILDFKFNIDNETFTGIIDQTNLSINITTYKDITNIFPKITISPLAKISPDAEISQDFTSGLEYTVTAQNGTSNVYKVHIIKPEITSTITKCYIRAVSLGQLSNIDLLSDSNYKLYLENDKNSYLLNYFDPVSYTSENKIHTAFYFKFDERILTANNYKLRVKLNGEIKAETNYTIDVLAENAPKIISANQTSYNYSDTLILTGTNLIPGLSIPANGNTYNLTEYHVTLNPEKTTLKYYMSLYQMFPSFMGQQSPRSTRVSVYNNGRYGDSIILDFK